MPTTALLYSPAPLITALDAMTQDIALTAAKLNQETARIDWTALQPFFARGQTVLVRPGLDLVAVATAFADDRRDAVAGWMETGDVAHVTDAQAETWSQTNEEMWAVVVAPWVLIQPVA